MTRIIGRKDIMKTIAYAIATFALTMLLSVSVAAQDPAPPLWQSLAEGDTPAQVATKLAGVEGIRSAKVSKGKVKIRHAGRGILIHGQPFKVAPVFQGGRLSQVLLATGDMCVGDAAALSGKVKDTLALKYPFDFATETEFDGRAISDAVVSAAPDQPGAVHHVRTGEDVAVMLRVSVSMREAPPVLAAPVSGAITAVSDLLWADYESHVRACPRYGDRRARVELVYMSLQQLERVTRAANAEVAAQQGEASGAL
jgi:hypothetical protein